MSARIMLPPDGRCYHARMSGILVHQDLHALLRVGAIGAETPVRPEQVQPSSLDLRLGARGWSLRCSFLPGTTGVAARLPHVALDEVRLETGRPLVLQQGCVYLLEVEETLALPADVSGRANPKSSTGRLDVFARLLTETGYAFDTVPAGYRGRLYLEVTPQSFHVGVRRGDCLAQVRFGRGDARLTAEELAEVQAHDPVVVWSDGRPAPVAREGGTPGLELSVDLLEGDGDVVGYTALRHRAPIDLARRDLPRDRHWTPLRADTTNEGHVLEPEAFYIYATRERLRIPPHLCAELVPFDATKGELRTHYAGFIDSGFGWIDGDRSGGARLVLELRTHDVPFLLEHGQPLFRLEILRNRAVPEATYGVGSHYQMQGLKLAKQFR
jgi:dCTP deaminase